MKKHKVKKVMRRHRRGVLDLKEIARMCPWTVNVEYQIKRGFSPGGPAFDRMLFALVGRSSDGSGAGGRHHGNGAGGFIRDHYWSCRTGAEALELAKALATVPGIERLDVHCNVIEDILVQEVELARKEKRLIRYPDGRGTVFGRGVRRRHRVRGKRVRLRRVAT